MSIRRGNLVRVVQRGEHGLKLGTIGRTYIKHDIDGDIFYTIGSKNYRASIPASCLEVIN